jgi:hypothetical protein
MLDTLKSLGKRKPSRQALEATISGSLEQSPLAESPKPLDDQSDGVDPRPAG